MKRFLSAVLALVLIGSAMGAMGTARASDMLLTDDDQFKTALMFLNVYLRGEKRETLQQISDRFLNLAAASDEAGGFFFYVSALIALEDSNLSLAEIYINSMEQNSALQTLLEDTAFQKDYPAIRGVKAMKDYISGRKAHNRGEQQTAMQYYAMSMGFLNSTELYNQALQEYLKQESSSTLPPTPAPASTPAAPAVTPYAISAYNLQDIGQNLLVGSEAERESKNGFLSIPVREALSGHEGETVTISFDLQCDATATLWFYAYQGSGVSISNTSQSKVMLNVRAGNIYQRFAITTTVHDYGRQVSDNGARLSEGAIAFYDARTEGKATFKIRRIKIELGSQATEWTPSIQEMTPTPAPMSSSLTASSVVVPMSSVPGNINPNLFAGGAEERQSKNGFLGIPCRDVLKGHVGKTITISFDLKVNGECTLMIYAYQESGLSIDVSGSNPKIIPVSATPGYVRYAFTTSVKDFGLQIGKNGELLSSGVIAFYDPNTAKKVDFSICRIKIEEGSYATNWSLAPEDQTPTPVPVITPRGSMPENLAALGQNLLEGSEAERESQNGFLSISTSSVLEGLMGQTISISFELQADRDCTLSIYAYQDSGLSIANNHNNPLIIQATAGSRFLTFSATTTVVDYGRQLGKNGQLLSAGAIAIYDQSTKEKANFKIRRIKIELGDRATAWSLALSEQPTPQPTAPPIPVLTPMVKAPAAATAKNQNLLDNSEAERKSKEGFLMINLKDALESHIGEKITITLEISVSKNRDLMVYPYQSSGVSIADTQYISVSAGSYQRFCIRTTVKDFGRADAKYTAGALAIYDSSQKDKVSFTVRRIKVELGDTPTQWTPSLREQVTSTTPAPKLTLTVTSNREVNTLRWNALANVESYTIMKKRDNAEYAKLTTLTATSYSDMSVVGYISYTYKVVAKLRNGVSITSNEVRISTTPARRPITGPDTLRTAKVPAPRQAVPLPPGRSLTALLPAAPLKSGAGAPGKRALRRSVRLIG